MATNECSQNSYLAAWLKKVSRGRGHPKLSVGLSDPAQRLGINTGSGNSRAILDKILLRMQSEASHSY